MHPPSCRPRSSRCAAEGEASGSEGLQLCCLKLARQCIGIVRSQPYNRTSDSIPATCPSDPIYPQPSPFSRLGVRRTLRRAPSAPPPPRRSTSWPAGVCLPKPQCWLLGIRPLVAVDALQARKLARSHGRHLAHAPRAFALRHLPPFAAAMPPPPPASTSWPMDVPTAPPMAT